MSVLTTIAQPDGNFFRLSDIFTGASFLVLVTVYIVNARNATRTIGAKFGMLESVLKGVQEELKNMQQVLVTQAMQSERLNSQAAYIAQMQRDISDLRRGEGYIIAKNQQRVSQ